MGPPANKCRRQRLLTLAAVSLLVAGMSMLGPALSTGGQERAGAEARPPGPAAPTAAQELERLGTEGVGALHKGDLAAAEKAFQAGLDQAAARNDRSFMARFLGSLGSVCYARGQLDRALAYYQRDLAFEEALGEQEQIAGTLNNLAAVASGMGQIDKAREYLARAMLLFEGLGKKAELATALANLGKLYHLQGQFQKALECQTRALAAREALGNPEGIALSLSALGATYRRLGQWNQAAACLTRALALQEPLGNPDELAGTLTNLGNLYSDRHDGQKAAACLTRALALQERLGNPGDLAATLINLGNILGQMGQFEKAQAFHSRALALAEPLGSRPLIAAALHNLGNAAFQLQQTDKARQYYLRALSLRKASGDEQQIAETLAALGRLEEEQQQWQAAEASYAEAVRYREAVRLQIGDPSQVGAYQAATEGDLYARCTALLASRGRPAEALAMAERGRAQGLARQIALSQVDLSRLLSREDAAQLAARVAALTAVGKQLYVAESRPDPAELAAKSALEAERDQARRQYTAAELQLTLFRDRLFTRYPEFGRVQGRQSPTPFQLDALAGRHPDTLFLEWSTADDRTTLLALSQKNGLRSFALPIGRAALQQQVDHWRMEINGQSLQEPRTAAAMDQTVFGPLEKAGLLQPRRYARLALVPDGPLFDLPFAALRDSAGKRLIERFALSTSVSLGALTWPASSRKAVTPLLYAADPLGPKGAALQVARRAGFGPLKFARAETEQVAKLFPGAVGLVGPAAREGAVKAQMGRCALLHFATHGELDEQDGLRSALLLAPEPLASPEDGRLEAREILGIPLAAKLAVLSACHTGEGQPSGGDGLLGLAWAFRAAGCPSVVASQWAVDDRATGALMLAFYRALRSGRRKDEALRTAMLAVRNDRDPEHARPFFWAGFTVIGETAPIGGG
jgi:CHAT domain-containing protein/Tfp pilus assembly protein PilF